jgi:hypothetical protein
MMLKMLLRTCLAGVAFCCNLPAQTNPTAQTPPAGQTAQNAQTPPASTNTAAALNATQFPHSRIAPPPEVLPPAVETPLLWSGYETHFAAEFGGRSAAITGNRDVYRTFVNLQPGVRLLDQSLEMHSINHNGALFDDLSESSFGLGGDPNQVIQLRASKNRWYDFLGSWRHNINFWDYNLLANPYNTPTSTLFIPINVSPALLDLSRKMLDLNLTLLPQSSVQFVLGYSHYRNNGSSYNTVHWGTEAELSQPWNNVSDAYRFGVSWLPAERTRITYDQFYTHEKNETNSFLNFFPYQLSNGTPVNLGITFAGTTPCATPFIGSFVNPTCNLYTSYSNVSPYSTDIPTEQLGFETTYWRRLHIAGRGTYTGADTYMPYSNETFNGIDTTGAQRQGVPTGRAKIQQITTTADFGVTYDITERLSIDDQFRWYAYRIPGAASFLQTYLFGSNALVPPNMFPSATCPPPYTGPGCPQHVAGSPADQSATNYAMFQSHDQKRNTFQVNYDFGNRITAYIGYEFEQQRFVVDGSTASLSTFFPTLPNRGGCTARPVNGVCQNATTSISTAFVQINTHGGLFGVAAQPVHGLRLNGDVLIDYSDNVFTNIMPRHMQLYRVKAIYTPKTWLDFHATFRDQEMRNLAAGLGNLQHNRNFSVGTVVSISPRWGIDLNYSYNNLLTNLNICFNETPTPAFASVSSICPVGYLTALSYYRNIDNFASGNLIVKPFARTTLTAGYTITNTTGNNLLLNPNAPLGPAAINYHLPHAAVALDVAKHVTLKAGWNLYDYIEKSPPRLILPRNFRGNVITISLRYAI